MCGLRLGLKARAWARKPGLRPTTAVSQARGPKFRPGLAGLGPKPGLRSRGRQMPQEEYLNVKIVDIEQKWNATPTYRNLPRPL